MEAQEIWWWWFQVGEDAWVLGTQSSLRLLRAACLLLPKPLQADPAITSSFCPWEGGRTVPQNRTEHLLHIVCQNVRTWQHNLQGNGVSSRWPSVQLTSKDSVSTKQWRKVLGNTLVWGFCHTREEWRNPNETEGWIEDGNKECIVMLRTYHGNGVGQEGKTLMPDLISFVKGLQFRLSASCLNTAIASLARILQRNRTNLMEREGETGTETLRKGLMWLWGLACLKSASRASERARNSNTWVQRQSGGKIPSSLFPEGLQLIEGGPVTLWKVVCFIQSPLI